MKKLFVAGLCILAMSFTKIESNFQAAVQTASSRHELIMINFSGSDWCGPCMRMRKEIFENEIFSKMADSTLVFFNADFPRNKKNQLDKNTIKQNETLADKYNPDGNFPFTVLINPEGKVIKSWVGLPNMDVASFTQQVKTVCDANK